MDFSMNTALKQYTSFRIGGPCPLLVEPSNEEQLCVLIQKLQDEHFPYFVLGKGSNVLFGDKGYQGIIVHIGKQFDEIRLVGDNQIFCQSGASLAQLCTFAQRHGLTGLEFAYGIPGSVGGAVYMNAGAYGGEMKDVVAECSAVDTGGNLITYDSDALEFGYRHSVFSENNAVITSVVFTLELDKKEAVKAKMDDLMNRRKTKQPLEYPSAGSTFKRPEGNYASALVDQCGLKGQSVGGAMVSEKHAGFIINYDNATCQDVLDLIRLVQQEVKAKTGYDLECEVKVIL